MLELSDLEKGVTPLRPRPHEDGGPGPPIVETDLAVQDFSSDEEFYKKSKAWFNFNFGRKNFFLEAKRPCVICLSEKEHTLVPPHAARNAPSSELEDHRFCTDCWEDFLQHARSSQASMICPVCRGEILIPEVWTQRLQLPRRWSQEEAPASAALPLPVVSVPHYEESRWLFRPAEASLWAWQRMGSCLGRGREISFLYEEMGSRTRQRRWYYWITLLCVLVLAALGIIIWCFRPLYE